MFITLIIVLTCFFVLLIGVIVFSIIADRIDKANYTSSVSLGTKEMHGITGAYSDIHGTTGIYGTPVVCNSKDLQK